MIKTFGSLSISRKIAAVFISLLFMMGIGGLVGLYNAKQLANVTESLYTDSFKRGETLSSVENEFLSARQEIFLHAIISDETSRTYLEGLTDGHRKKIDRLLEEYEKSGVSAGQEALLGRLTVSLSEYWTINGRITSSSLKGDRQASLNLIRTAGNDSFTAVLNSLKKLSIMEKDSAFAAYQKSDFFAGVIIIVTIAFTLAALILAVGLWNALTRSIVRPILAIEESAKKIGQGKLDQRVPVVTEDEIGNLAIEFNKMSENLENYYATLEKKVAERTEKFETANRELMEKERDMEFANMELLEANAIKSQFLANVSHELRTPLNSIIGFSELLLERAFGDLNERQAQYVEFVHSSGGHLLQLINNILDLSKIEAGRMGVIMEDFPILESIGEILGIIRPIAHQRNITIESKTAIASPMIRADKVKFKQILINLLNNAVKFNVDGGKITVDWDIVEEPSGMKMERFYVFRIKDTGIGVKKDDLGKLFMEFEQIDSSFSREYSGTGLGLAITRRLVELHKGKIWVESEPGVGSTFYVKMPKGTEDIDAPVFTQTVNTNAQDAGDRPLVLIASESQDINRLLEIYLQTGYYEVAAAPDGIELLRKARDLKPFAIVMGISIPKKDGW
ncbi:MAG: ATP-binding protein, partial [Deltaproteobacteria bacterium]